MDVPFWLQLIFRRCCCVHKFPDTFSKLVFKFKSRVHFIPDIKHKNISLKLKNPDLLKRTAKSSTISWYTTVIYVFISPKQSRFENFSTEKQTEKNPKSKIKTTWIMNKTMYILIYFMQLCSAQKKLTMKIYTKCWKK